MTTPITIHNDGSHSVRVSTNVQPDRPGSFVLEPGQSHLAHIFDGPGGFIIIEVEASHLPEATPPELNLAPPVVDVGDVEPFEHPQLAALRAKALGIKTYVPVEPAAEVPEVQSLPIIGQGDPFIEKPKAEPVPELATEPESPLPGWGSAWAPQEAPDAPEASDSNDESENA